MSVKYFNRTNFSMPYFRRTAGELIDVFDACLVNGFGDQTVTITSTGGVATITCTSPHGIDRVGIYSISSANESDYNGDFQVTVVDSVTLSYPILNSPASPATGTITGRMPGAGWTKEFSGTNKAAYKQGAGSNGKYLRVEDISTTSANIRGYDTMSSVDSGLNAFPTTAQDSTFYINKGSSTSYDPEFVLLVTESTLFWHVNGDNSVDGGSSSVFYFGDLDSYVVSDTMNTIIIGTSSTSPTSSNQFHLINNSLSGTTAYHFINGNYNQIVGSFIVGKSPFSYNSTILGGVNQLQYPHPIDSSLHLSTLEIFHDDIVRGKIKGIWAPLHYKPITHNSTFEGTGDLSGKTFKALSMYNVSQVIVEISDTY